MYLMDSISIEIGKNINSVFESLDVAICINTIMDPGKVCLWGNTKYKSFLGMTIEELNDGGLEKVIANYHPDDMKYLQDSWSRVIQMNETYYFVSRYATTPGNYRWYYQVSTPLDAKEDGTMGRMVNVTIDITDRIREDKHLQALIRRNLNLRALLKICQLTRQQQIVLKLIVAGFIDKEIALQLKISPETVHIHRKRILKKLEFQNIAQLVAFTAPIAEFL